MCILSGKRGLVVGVSNKWSIGSQIAKECHNQGADVFVTWHSERSKNYVQSLANELNLKSSMTNVGSFQLDITEPNIHQIIKDGIRFDYFGGLDFIVHSVAKAPKECFEQQFSCTTLNQFNETMKASVWSFINLVNNTLPLLNNESSLLTMSYIGGRKIRPGYNVMGIAKAALEATMRELAFEVGKPKKIRVNVLSPGPIKTTSSSKIKVKETIAMVKNISPLGYAPTQNEVSKVAAFLCSDMSMGISGSIIDIDSGYNIMLSTVREE